MKRRVMLPWFADDGGRWYKKKIKGIDLLLTDPLLFGEYRVGGVVCVRVCVCPFHNQTSGILPRSVSIGISYLEYSQCMVVDGISIMYIESEVRGR